MKLEWGNEWIPIYPIKRFNLERETILRNATR